MKPYYDHGGITIEDHETWTKARIQAKRRARSAPFRGHHWGEALCVAR